MMLAKNYGREYTIALSAEYTVEIDNSFDMCEAEDLAWAFLEEGYKNSDVNEYEIYETLDIRQGFTCYFVKVKVNSVVYVVANDITDAYNEAVDLIENISMPDEAITLNSTEQTDLIRAGEQVVEMVSGDK